MEILVNCAWCNKILKRYKKYDNYFCNQKCHGKWKSENLIGRKAYNYKGKIKIKCSICNKIYYVTDSYFKGQKHYFCSKECANKGQEKYGCGKNNPSWKGGEIKFNCDYCSKLCEQQKSQYELHENHFCDKICRSKWQSKFCTGKNAYNYIHGNSKLPYPLEFNEPLKEFVRKRDSYKCQCCGCTQLENKYQLDVHHIDYDKFNNDPINLISLCHKCHVKTNGNRKYWQNHFEQIQIDRKVHLLNMKLEMEEKIE